MLSYGVYIISSETVIDLSQATYHRDHVNNGPFASVPKPTEIPTNTVAILVQVFFSTSGNPCCHLFFPTSDELVDKVTRRYIY